MAELAAGAVSTLLGVIRSEARLLGGVGDDVQFIKEEMESMKGFLEYMARTAPPGSGHSEQVQPWMHQVRLLAQDCRSCIDLYLYGCNPEIHRARGGVWRYFWWLTWLPHKTVAQHRAAIQLRQLKDRAREVSERRSRYWYSVEVPAKAASGGQWPPMAGVTAAPPAEGGDEEADAEQLVEGVATDHYSGRRALINSLTGTLEDYFQLKLLLWLHEVPANAKETMSIVIVAPEADTDQKAIALANETLVFSPDRRDYYFNGYHRSVLVDIRAVHHEFLPLRTKEVLYYILRELQLEHANSQSQQQGTDKGEWEYLGHHWQVYYRKWDIHYDKKRVLCKIKENIKEMEIYEKLDKIKCDIRVQQLKDHQLQQLLQQDLEQKKGVYQMNLELDVLLQLLLQSAAAASQQDQLKTKKMHHLAAWYDGIITKLAEKLKEHMEANEKANWLNEQMGVQEKEETAKHMEVEAAAVARSEGEGGGEGDDDEITEEIGVTREQMAPIRLHEAQYAHVLREVFPKTSSSKLAQQQDRSSTAKQATKTTLTTSGENQIKQMVQEVKQEILRELQEGRSDMNQTACVSGALGQNGDAVFEEIEKKMGEIKQELKEQLKIKGLVDEIKLHLKNECPLIILRVDEKMDASGWEYTRNALSLLDCSADLLIVTTTKGTQRAKEYCYPRREPIDYSVVGRYHDTVLELTSQQNNDDNYNSQIFRDILEECEPHEFCMKIFAHALYAKPKRSHEELHKLHSSLKAISPKSSVNNIATTMLQFSYNSLSKDYKSCLMYLAIFPKGCNIRRSTLIARWVAEGLITKEDWHTSVCQAERCFDALIDQFFIYPADISATGKVKSCMVNDLIHGFITKLARKEHIVETSLSHHLARHFSIFNGLQLRSSDRIGTFFQKLSESSQLSLLKVLDLEGCQCFDGKKQRYIKDICTKMLLLKYLSLRGTDITRLPSAINNLRELEVLDIRETMVPPDATINILLLKLKRLLAGHNNLNPSNSGTVTAIRDEELVSSVQIPQKIEKMVNLEVLSNVKTRICQDISDIGRLWQLRKLGVVIDDKTSHLKSLLRMISDLHECLRSLSITLPIARSEETPFGELPAYCLKQPPKLLESLSISGTTRNWHLLPLFDEDGNNKLAKVTLSSTSLNQDDLKVLAKLPMLRCVRLRHIACFESTLTFKKDEFKYLEYLLVEGSNLTEIIFEDGAACELAKMVLSFTNIGSVFGINNLPRLKELQFNGGLVPSEVKEAIKKHRNKPTLKHNTPEIQDRTNGDEQEDDDDAARFSFC